MSSYVDPVFPLPEPAFLFVHELTLWKTGAAVTVGAGRKWRSQVTSSPFGGYLTAPNPREVDRAARRDVRIDAVALAPNTLTLDEADEVEATADVSPGYAAVPTVLVGRYTIHAVRPNPSHTRILLTRIRGEATPHAP